MKNKNNNKSSDKVKADYNRISNHFSSTRSYEWPEMTIFSKYIKNGMKILDLGCGNGRLLASLKSKKIEYLGIDSAVKLIKLAREMYPKRKFEIMDMASLKLEKESFDAVFAIASLHHLPKLLRITALKEANRVLKKDGYFFITVWNLWQKKYRKYIWRNLASMIFTGGKTQFGDTFIPWKDPNQNVLAERYYFAYTLNGLKEDLAKTGFEILEIKKSRFNIYAICRK